MSFSNKPMEWNNEGVAPSNSLKQNGFQGGYKPPAPVFNYFFNKTAACIDELQTVVDEKEEKSFIITVTENNKIYSADKTFSDINSAYKAGKKLYVEYDGLVYILDFAVEDSSYTFHNIRLYNTYLVNIMQIIIDKDNKISLESICYSIFTDAITNATVVGGLDTFNSDSTLGENAFLTGGSVSAMGQYDFAEGYQTTAMSGYSHCEGYSSVLATDIISELSNETTNETILNAWKALSTENKFSLAKGKAHSEGNSCLALGTPSHAEGWGTAATGDRAHSQGAFTTASGKNSHAQGMYTEAKGICSHAGGAYTIANNYQFVTGKYNTEYSGNTSVNDKSSDNTIFMVGNGAEAARSNAFRITADGKCRGTASFVASGADFAEYFEWLDGNLNNEDRRGKFVTLDGEKIRIANADDDYILGVVSGTGAFIGNSSSEEWQGKYLKDVFGETLTEQVEVPETTDEETGEIIPAHIVTQFVLNPDYDPNQEYISREFRKEWSPVGFHGQLIVVDDGSCEANGYCKSGDNGIATASNNGYRVMSRIDDTHIKVLIK